MTFEQYLALVRDWQSRYTPAQARYAAEGISAMSVEDWPEGFTHDMVMILAAKGEPASVSDGKADPAPKAPPNLPAEARPSQGSRGRPSVRAKALVREQLKHGPRPEASVMAAASFAEIPECTLIAAADALGVRTRKGRWWLPG